MARNPRDLIVETILEGYRQEQRILAGDRPDDADADMFGELFAKAQADGKLAAHVDVAHLSRSGSDACQRGRSALGARQLRRPVLRRCGGPRHRRPDRGIQPTAH